MTSRRFFVLEPDETYAGVQSKESGERMEPVYGGSVDLKSLQRAINPSPLVPDDPGVLRYLPVGVGVVSINRARLINRGTTHVARTARFLAVVFALLCIGS